MTRRIKHRPPPDWLRAGVVVDYCSVIGEAPTQHGLTVRTDPQQMDSGHWVVWLEGKSGCVHVDACVKPTPCGTLRDPAVGPFDQSHPCVLPAGHETAGRYAIDGVLHHVDSTDRCFPVARASKEKP